MFESLRRLFDEQTSAPELASFIVVVTVLCVLAAVVGYLLIMTLVWLVGLRPRHSWRQVVVPDLVRFRRFTWEYLLALATSTVLALTLADKHEIVEAVLSQPADELLGTQKVSALLPLRRTPTVEELGGPGTSGAEEFAGYLEGQAVAGFNLQVAGLLRPALAAGREGEVRAVLHDVLRRVLQRDPGIRTRVRQGLLFGCLVLFAGYLGWYVRGRARQIVDPADRNDGTDGEALRRFAMIGVCVALLIATPALARDPERLAESAVEAIRRYQPPPGRAVAADILLTRAIDRQYQLHGALRALADFRDSATVMGALGGLGGRLTTLDGSLSGLAGRLTVLDGSLTQLVGRQQTLSGEITAIRQDLERQRASLAETQRAATTLGSVLEGFRGELGALKEQTDQSQRRLAAISARLDSIGAQAGRADRLAGELQAQIRTLSGTELLLVEAGQGFAYSIARSAGGAPVARGSVRGVHRLPPDTYVVSAGESDQRVALRVGSPQWVTLAPLR